MKKSFLKLALAVLTVGLFGSCSKINERLDNLEKKVSGIENEQIASINSQISGITSSIADLGQIRSDISSLKQSAENHGIDIFNLEEADRALADRILNLEDYLDDVLPNYAEKEWVEATFSTLEQYEETCDTIAKIDARIGALDAKLSKDIKACADSLTKWVNKTFEGYYTAAQMDAKLGQMKSDIDSARAAGKITDAKADSLAGELTKTKAAVDTAKANIRKEYRAAIDTAIKTSEGKLTKELTDAISEVNGKIESLVTRVDNLAAAVADLTGRVKALEEMIQSVVIVPAYSDGSVEVDYEKDSLYINCIVSPVSAVSGLTKANFKVLVNKVLTKAVDVKTISITEDKWFSKDAKNGTVSLKVPVKNYIPESADSSLTVAVNVNNGISDFTTEFVPVTVPVSVSLDKHSIVIKSSESAKDTTLTATVKNSSKGVIWSNSNNDIAAVDNGKVTIKANASGKDTIVVKTVEGNATDTCFITVWPKGALAGEFSVSATKKVYFSMGNLWAKQSPDKDESYFEENQYSSKSDWVPGHLSLLTWSSTAREAANIGYSGDNLFCDENHKVSVDGSGTIYYALSLDEWKYLINKDGNENIRKDKFQYGVTVCGKANCLILAPDECLNGYSFDSTKKNYTADEWATAEAAGLVCLPAAGYRSKMSFSDEGYYGYYWSSNNNESIVRQAYLGVKFDSSNVDLGDSVERDYGYSIRLVTEVK